MNPLERIMKGRFGAAARAGAGFVTVSIIGAIGLVVVAVVLWAASLTPFGLWAGLPVIAAGAIAARVLWRQGQANPQTLPQDFPSAESPPPSSGWRRVAAPGWVDGVEGGVARPARVKLIGLPASPMARTPRLGVKRPEAPDAEDLKRVFDQAFAAGRFDEAERVLAELEGMPGQVDWTRRKQRLVRQQRTRS